MFKSREVKMLADDFEALASTASNPLAKAQWAIMAEDYQRRAEGIMREGDVAAPRPQAG